MNFFKLYIGDYQRDTGTLTLAEHGAYLLMLQHLYATEQPLPTGRDLHRLLRAESKAERDAIDRVASRFWVERDGGLVNGRAMDEIQKGLQQRAVNREVGKRGGRPKKAPPETESDSETKTDSVSKTKTESVSESVPKSEPNHNPNQTPDTRHQTVNDRNAHTDNPRAPDPDPPDAPDGAVRASPSMAGAVCVALRAAGMPRANPSHPKLLALVGQGAGVDAFVAAWHDVRAAGKAVSDPFAYVLGRVAGQLAQAQQVADAATVVPLRPAPKSETFRERDDRLARERVASLTGRSAQPAGVVIDVESTMKRIAE